MKLSAVLFIYNNKRLIYYHITTPCRTNNMQKQVYKHSMSSTSQTKIANTNGKSRRRCSKCRPRPPVLRATCMCTLIGDDATDAAMTS